MSSPNLTVHHLQSGQGERIPWLLEELNIPYKLKLYQRAPYFSPPELESLTPMGAAPVLDDHTAGTNVTIYESSAVVEYIVNKHGSGKLALDPSHKNYADYVYWFHFSNGSLQPGVLRAMTAKSLSSNPPDSNNPFLNSTEPADPNPRIQMTAVRLERMLAHFDTRLRENTWLAGEEFTAADVMSLFTFTTMRMFGPMDLGKYDGIVGWLQRCTEREGYRRAMEKCDPELLGRREEFVTAKGPARFVPKASL